MTVKIEQARLIDGLKKVQAAANAKMINGILGNVKIVAKGGKVAFTTTNLDITLHCTEDCTVDEEGETLISVARLVSAVTQLSSGEVTINDKGEKISVSCGTASFKFPKLDIEAYPKFDADAVKCEYTMPSKVLSGMLRKTSYAQSADETRTTLKSVLIAIQEGKIRCVATDGRRLAVCEEELSNADKSAASTFLVPSMAINVLQKFVDSDSDADITISSLEGKVRFTMGDSGYVFYAKLVDGDYPNYSQVIPKDTATTATISRSELITALNRVSVMALTYTTAVRMKFSNNRLGVDVNSEDSGTANDEIPIKYDGEEIEIRFNPKYVLDPIRAADSDEITIGLNNGHAPAVFRGIGEKFMCVLMPLRIN